MSNAMHVHKKLKNTGDQDSIASILDFVRENAQQVEFPDGSKHNIVLVMGNTGAGKSTLVSFLTKAALTSKETRPNGGEYVIVDEKRLVGGLSTTVSETSKPNLMVHLKSGTIYYDCPGFNDTRGVKNDISVTYCSRELIRKVNSIKLVFAVSYPSVQNGTGDRRSFVEFAQHATTFIKNIRKFENGIAMVVTKVENRRIERHGQFYLVDDSDIVESVADFLEQLRKDLTAKITNVDRDQAKYKNVIKLINILLKKNTKNQYEKIGILRLADRNGPMKNIPMLIEERLNIKKIVHDQLSYIQKDDLDFDYSISEESKNHIRDIMEEMQHRLTKDVQRIGEEIKQFYTHHEWLNFDIHFMKKQMAMASQSVVASMKYEQIVLFEQQISNTATRLGIETLESLKQFSQDITFVMFFQSVSNTTMSDSFSISSGLVDLKNYLKESQDWYNFLIVFHDDLSKYEVQKDIFEFVRLKERLLRQCSEEENQTINVEDIALKSLVDEIGCEMYYTIQDIKLNSSKLKTLGLVVKQAMDDRLTITSTKDKIVVKGHNVKLSSIPNINSDAYKYVEVFALNNLFIDVDIDKTGQNAQISFIAPNWYIIGERNIILNGKDGEPHSESKATEGDKIGLPGKPGGSAGNFIGIGKRVINDQNLCIQLNGGKGGPGQDGGDGVHGVKGESANSPPIFVSNPWKKQFPVEKRKIYDYLLFGRNIYTIIGKSSKRPGDGSDGGRGGLGGHSGNESLMFFTKQPSFRIRKNKGDDGPPGKGGVGGNNANNGDTVNAEYIHVIKVFQIYAKKKLVGATNDGQTVGGRGGVDGSNSENMDHPTESQRIDNLHVVPENYKFFLTSNLANNVQSSVLDEFFNEFVKRSLFENASEQKPVEPKKKSLMKRLATFLK